MKKEDLNIIFVDWSHKASGDYFIVVENVNKIGKEIAKFINKSGIHPNKIHCIGHSLGKNKSRIELKPDFFIKLKGKVLMYAVLLASK